MLQGSTISCVCNIEFAGLSEFSALDEVYKMFEKEYNLERGAILKLTEIRTSSSDGCAISYSPDSSNG
jgi:hypothetical protein